MASGTSARFTVVVVIAAGTDAQDLPYVVRPADFGASQKVFKLMDTFLPGVEANSFIYPSADGLVASRAATNGTSGHLTVTNGAGMIALTLTGGPFDGFANPTAQVGLAVVNGVATTAMRSDAAPARSSSSSLLASSSPMALRRFSFHSGLRSHHSVIHSTTASSAPELSAKNSRSGPPKRPV